MISRLRCLQIFDGQGEGEGSEKEDNVGNGNICQGVGVILSSLYIVLVSVKVDNVGEKEVRYKQLLKNYDVQI